VLGHEVRVVETFGLVEHVLAKDALVEARGGDRADVVQMAGVDRLGELDHRARPFDVGRDLRLGVGREVVHRGQVVDVIDLALELPELVGADTEPLGGQIAIHRHHARLRAAAFFAPVGEQLRQLGFAFAPEQEVDDGTAPREQGLDESPADEAGRSGDEVAHAKSLLWRRAPAAPARGDSSAEPRSKARGKPGCRTLSASRGTHLGA